MRVRVRVRVRLRVRVRVSGGLVAQAERHDDIGRPRHGEPRDPCALTAVGAAQPTAHQLRDGAAVLSQPADQHREVAQPVRLLAVGAAPA